MRFEHIERYGNTELPALRAASQVAAQTLHFVGERLKAGMTTREIDMLVRQDTVRRGGQPSQLGYHGFPASVCTSRNQVVCHGIPSATEVLMDGDIINVDVTTYYPREHGFHGDTSATFYVGAPSDSAKLVVETARKCLELGIAEVRDGARIGDIGAAIQEHAHAQGCSVVRDYVGHGIGREFHMAPQVPHYGTRGSGKRMKAGMIFTIEPMINIGHWECRVLDDDWTVVTADGSLSAQFEHTVLVTQAGCEVLTARQQVLKQSEDVEWAALGPKSAPAAFRGDATAQNVAMR